MTCRYHKRTPQSCTVVFQRKGYDVETLYWAGSIDEARELAEEIAFKAGVDTYRIVEFSGNREGYERLSAVASDA